MNIVLAAVLQELEAAIAVCDRRATFIHVLYSDSTITLIPLPCLGNGAESAAVPPSMPADGGTAPGTTDADGELTERERAVLRVLAEAEKPMKARTIGTRAKIPYTSHLREILAGLKEKDRIIIAPKGGYWPANRPLPGR